MRSVNKEAKHLGSVGIWLHYNPRRVLLGMEKVPAAMGA